MDLQTEIRSRKVLLSSAGSEFDFDLTISAAERLKISRANVKKTLGFDGISGMEELEKELVKDEDLTAANSTTAATTVAIPAVDLEKLSARERIAMKRKARLKAQAPPPAKQAKKSEEAISTSVGSSDNLSADNFESIESDAIWFGEKMKEKLLK